MAIVDVDAAARVRWTPFDLAAAFLAGGATLLQVRAKAAASGALLEIATGIVALAHQARARVIVNDRADIARLSGADGVHLGQDDLPAVLARRVAGEAAIVGVSTHTPAQLDDVLGAPQGTISYAAIGPVFGTATKATGYTALGLDAVRAAADRAGARGVPLVAIGGITLDTAADVRRAGAHTVAVIGDLLTGVDPEARVRAYLARLTI
jgi:thiamine-phosphate pyrophosphorylase